MSITGGEGNIVEVKKSQLSDWIANEKKALRKLKVCGFLRDSCAHGGEHIEFT